MSVKKYCFLNRLDHLILPICDDNLYLSKAEYDKGFRITSGTFGINSSDEIKEVSIVNSFSFENNNISFYYKGSVKTSDRTPTLTKRFVMSLKLVLITVDSDGQFNNDYVIENELEKIRHNISLYIPPILELDYDLNPSLFDAMRLRTDTLFEHVMFVVQNLNSDFIPQHKRMIPDDYSIQINVKNH